MRPMPERDISCRLGEAAPLHAIDSTTLSFSQPEHIYTFYIYLYIYSIAPGNDTGIIKTCYIHEHAFLCNF